MQLIPCADCGRKFSAKALERHVAVCKKVNTKRKASKLLREAEDAQAAKRAPVSVT